MYKTNRSTLKKVKRALVLTCSLLLAGQAVAAPVPNSLKTVAVPLPSLTNYVKDTAAAIRLGKALFWDMQVGSDGQTACATCHFSSGVDPRTVNTVNPGLNPGRNGVFDVTLPLDKTDFPFMHDDVVGSQGVVHKNFISLTSGSAVDTCGSALSTDRRVTDRNSPSTVLSVFHKDNFWDGRAKSTFNGVDISGNSITDPLKAIWVTGRKGMVKASLSISPASTASQAVGPPLNAVEMSCEGLTFPLLGRKMVNNGLTPLGAQVVHTTDSVLGSLSKSPATGLNTTYKAMIQAAFQSTYVSDTLVPNGSGFTQTEQNFSLFWGLAVMLYEATLNPNDTPFDKSREGGPALTAQQLVGQDVFLNKGGCAGCHGGPEFTNASIQTGGRGDFTNTAVRPVSEDGGVQPANDGEFKSNTIRNIELTGPYFHNGGYLTLQQLVDFYNRGGDHPSGATDAQITPLGLTTAEQTALVDFMLTLTDNRVKCEQAPFDRPSINIPNGTNLTAVGSAGRCSGTDTGIKPFLYTGDPQFHFQMTP
ncbi:MAG: cytochrome c peroxidase [Gallionellaceae bacterium]|nr:cytochrome c peroxidase [Gallionellaceae bacterium]